MDSKQQNGSVNRLAFSRWRRVWGGLESLCEIPATMTHKGMPEDVRENAGIYDDLIRLSVGVGDVDDLLQDLLEALEKATLK